MVDKYMLSLSFGEYMKPILLLSLVILILLVSAPIADAPFDELPDKPQKVHPEPPDEWFYFNA